MVHVAFLKGGHFFTEVACRVHFSFYGNEGLLLQDPLKHVHNQIPGSKDIVYHGILW